MIQKIEKNKAALAKIKTTPEGIKRNLQLFL